MPVEDLLTCRRPVVFFRT